MNDNWELRRYTSCPPGSSATWTPIFVLSRLAWLNKESIASAKRSFESARLRPEPTEMTRHTHTKIHLGLRTRRWCIDRNTDSLSPIYVKQQGRHEHTWISKCQESSYVLCDLPIERKNLPEKSNYPTLFFRFFRHHGRCGYMGIHLKWPILLIGNTWRSTHWLRSR